MSRGWKREMIIRVNGKETVLDHGLTLADFIAAKGFNPLAVVVERNQAVAVRDHWADIILQPGDTLEIVSFVGGG